MKRIWAMAFGALLLGSGMAEAQSYRPSNGELLLGMRDLDQDGRVSWDEAWLFALADFHAVDSDRSGALTPREFDALLVPDVADALGLLPNSTGILRVSTRPETPSAARFRCFDANRDGVVTLGELYPIVAAEFMTIEVKGD